MQWYTAVLPDEIERDTIDESSLAAFSLRKTPPSRYVADGLRTAHFGLNYDAD